MSFYMRFETMTPIPAALASVAKLSVHLFAAIRSLMGQSKAVRAADEELNNVSVFSCVGDLLRIETSPMGIPPVMAGTGPIRQALAWRIALAQHRTI